MDLFNRPDWDSYFMSIAFVAAMRSIDPSTKHGCVITKNKKILSIGYNGPPRGLNDEMIPLTRPEKYPFMTHAEENAILNSDVSMEDSVVYITGWPCHKCFRMLIQKGVSEIIYGPISWCQDDADMNATKLMLSAQQEKKTKMTEYLSKTLDYHMKKCPHQFIFV
jgi:dCMP deaminase